MRLVEVAGYPDGPEGGGRVSLEAGTRAGWARPHLQPTSLRGRTGGHRVVWPPSPDVLLAQPCPQTSPVGSLPLPTSTSLA